MLCVSSVVLLSSWQYSLECNLQKFWEISMIHGQPVFDLVLENQAEYVHCHEHSPRPKSDNLVGVIGSLLESDWQCISLIHSHLIHCQHYMDTTSSKSN